MEAELRPQHYTFAHRLVPTLFFSNPQGFFEMVQGDGDRYLQFLWKRAGQVAGNEDWVQPEGLAVEVIELGSNYRLGLITLPDPQAATEAYFLGLLLRLAKISRNGVLSQKARLITLEYSISVVDGSPEVVVGEWSSDSTRHIYHSIGSDPTRTFFIEAVKDLSSIG
jgi:hypothetical protein